MKIYSNQGIELLDIQVDDNSVRYRSIMSDDSLTLKFSHTTTVAVPVGSHVEFEGQRYTLWLPENFKKHNTRNFEYTVTLGGWREALKLFKFKDLSAMPYRLKFSLTAKPVDFVQLIVDNMNIHSSGWTVGSCIEAVERTLSFNHEYCFDVLARIAQEWATEFEIEGKKIHLRKVEKFKDAPLALSYGKGNGFKSGVGRANDGDKQPIGRLYVQGGERNIDFSTYGSSSLLLPKSQALIHEGKTYRTDAYGMFITRDGNDLIAEDSLDANHIYPKRVGTVGDVVIVDAENRFYDIKDASIPVSLDYSACRIDGEKATIKFESGALAGREFDIEQTDKALTGYVHTERRFKIVPQELDGIVMPGGVFVPKVGDKYAILNISMPDSYIADNSTKTGASWEMFQECVKYFAENEKQKFSFTGELDGIWAKNKWLEIGGKIVPGGHVNFSDTQFLPAGEIVRIVSVKDYVNFPHKPEITLSNAPISGGFNSTLGKLEAEEVVIEGNRKDGLLYSKRQWRDARETMALLEESLLKFGSGINPITVRTMQLLVGDESLQFRFVNNKTAPTQVNHSVSFDGSNKKLTASAGIIQHMTLGIEKISPSHKADEYKYWDMPQYISPPLDGDKAYYLYAKCSETTQAGTFLLSETPIEMESAAGFYHLLAAIVNREADEGRSIAPLYGFTEILPGRVTTDLIVSSDGKTYFDLVNSVIGGKLKFLSNGVEKDLSAWADSILNNLNYTDQTIVALEDYLNDAFRDGIIEGAEAKAIETYINQINSDKAGLEAVYNKLYVNPLLAGTPSSNLLNAKISYFGTVDNLINSIVGVISDGKVTPSEKQSINAIFGTYRSAKFTFSARTEEAKQFVEQVIKSIADDAKNTANNAQTVSAAAQASANIARAITDKFGTTIDGGLVSTVMMLLREFDSLEVTAGINGLRGALKNNPAFWAGGTYEQAFALINFLSKMSAGTTPATGEYAGLAKITMLHNGAAKIGDFIIEEAGKITLVDPDTGKSRLVFSAQNIPLLADLLSSITFGNSITATSTSLVAPSSGIITSYLVGTLNVEKNGSTIDITGGTHFNLNGLINDSGVSITASLDLMRNDVKYQALESSVLTYGMDGSLGTVGGRKLTGLPSGTYRLQLSIRKLGTGGNSSAMIVVGSIPMSWSFQQSGIRNFLFGLNGFLSFFSDRHIYFSEEHGFDLKGQTNMPGVLASGTVSTGGVLSNEWGAKVNYGQTITGGYRIFLKEMTHNKYSVQVTPHTNVTFRVSTKTSTYFEILGTGAADFVVFGSNY